MADYLLVYFRVWHDTATPFKDVLQEFQIWMEKHSILEKESGGPLHRAAFITWLVHKLFE